jgi:hypothetical protein
MPLYFDSLLFFISAPIQIDGKCRLCRILLCSFLHPQTEVRSSKVCSTKVRFTKVRSTNSLFLQNYILPNYFLPKSGSTKVLIF